MKSTINKDEIKSNLNALFNLKSESQLIERDSLMLQANYLSEIERLTKLKGINRREIANKINTSPSYLTQVFRGDKPLNFLTLAKIKRALDLKFEVKASFKTEKKTLLNFDPKDYSIQKYFDIEIDKPFKIAYYNPNYAKETVINSEKQLSA